MNLDEVVISSIDAETIQNSEMTPIEELMSLVNTHTEFATNYHLGEKIANGASGTLHEVSDRA